MIETFWTSGSCGQRLQKEGKLAFDGWPSASVVLLIWLYKPNTGTHLPHITMLFAKREWDQRFKELGTDYIGNCPDNMNTFWKGRRITSMRAGLWLLRDWWPVKMLSIQMCSALLQRFLLPCSLEAHFRLPTRLTSEIWLSLLSLLCLGMLCRWHSIWSY